MAERTYDYGHVVFHLSLIAYNAINDKWNTPQSGAIQIAPTARLTGRKAVCVKGSKVSLCAHWSSALSTGQFGPQPPLLPPIQNGGDLAQLTLLERFLTARNEGQE